MPSPAPTPRRVAVASAVGATIEWYDFFLYGTAAGLVFDKLYFNGLHGPAAQFAAFGTFAVGFLARPVGGLLFGHFGDRLGRKQMLLLTLLIMGVGTAAIGLLPSYDAIGVWAPVLLVVLRVGAGVVDLSVSDFVLAGATVPALLMAKRPFAPGLRAVLWASPIY